MLEIPHQNRLMHLCWEGFLFPVSWVVSAICAANTSRVKSRLASYFGLGLEVLAALMGQLEQTLLWQECDETLGKLVYLSSPRKHLLFEQPSGNTILQGVSPIWCPHLHKMEILKHVGFVGCTFCRWNYFAAAGRLLWISLHLNTKGTGLRWTSRPPFIPYSNTNHRFHWYSKTLISFGKN